MTSATQTVVQPGDWQSANQTSLVAELETVKDLLRRHAERVRPPVNRENGASHPAGPVLSSGSANGGVASRRDSSSRN